MNVNNNFKCNLKTLFFGLDFGSTLIDGLTNEVIDFINVIGGSIAVNPNTNRIYVVNAGEEIISVIDGSISEVIDTISVKFLQNIIGINYETNLIYVIDHSPNTRSNNILVIDGATNEITTTIEGFGFINGIGVNSINNRIYITNAIADLNSHNHVNIISVVDGSTNKVIDTVNANSTFNELFGQVLSKVRVNPITNHIYVIEEGTTDSFMEQPESCPKIIPADDLEWEVKIIDGLTNHFIANDGLRFDLRAASIGIDINSNTNLAYVSNGFTGEIFVIKDEETLSPKLIAGMIVNPISAESSFRLREAIVTVMDQNGQPLSGITINTTIEASAPKSLKWPGAIVNPSSAVTGPDGTATFKFRFRYAAKNGKITFLVDGARAAITQE